MVIVNKCLMSGLLDKDKTPPFWAGLKFFNVYGPQEYHKGGQASVVHHAFPQIKEKGLSNFSSLIEKTLKTASNKEILYT